MPSLHYYRTNPLGFIRDVLKFEPTAAQARMLDARLDKVMLCCTRGFGKTEMAALMTCWELVVMEDHLSLVLSETAEKAAEMVSRVRSRLFQAGVTLEPDPLRPHGFRTSNGNRVLPVPSRPGAVRGHPANSLIIDEAALVPDAVWVAASGARASKSKAPGRVWLMSTPGPRRGFFYRLFHNGDLEWERFRVTAPECEHISAEYLAERRREMSDGDYNREFMARWSGDDHDAVFSELAFEDAIRASCPTLDFDTRFALKAHWNLGGDRVLVGDNRWAPRQGFYVAIDLAQARDYAAMAVIEYSVQPTGTHDPLDWRPHCEVKFRLRWLTRFPHGSSYTDIAQMVADMVMHEGELQERSMIVVDATGVGRGFVDYLRTLKCGAPIYPVQITNGVGIREAGGMTNMPKQDLVMTMDRVLRQGMFEIAAGLPCLAELREEMHGFKKTRMPNGKWGFGAMANATDDLVMAVALGVGYACYVHRPRSLMTAA